MPWWAAMPPPENMVRTPRWFEAQRPKIEGKLYAKAPVPDISAESAELIREWFAAQGPAFLR